MENPGSHSVNRRGLREEDLTAEDIAIMTTCEIDETWQTLRHMRPLAKKQLLSAALCILVQEVVEDNGLTEVQKTGRDDGAKMNATRPSCTTICTTCWKCM